MRVQSMVLAITAGAAIAGCGLLSKFPHAQHRTPPSSPPTFSQYHLDGWEWDGVARVLVLPFLNESPYTKAGVELRAACTSELQRLGRFEIVAAPEGEGVLSAQVHRGGQFDEAVMLNLARLTRADVIVHGTVTQYSPFPRPRLGFVLQVVSPEQAKVVASVDGLWDTTDVAVAERVRVFYRQRPRERPPWIRNHVIVTEDSFAGELALDSPALFQRFVCRETALTLLGLQVPGISGAGVTSVGPDDNPRCVTNRETGPATTGPPSANR